MFIYWNFLDCFLQDTLLNVFLAIAVDNLASAHVLAKVESSEQRKLMLKLKQEEDALKQKAAEAEEQKLKESLGATTTNTQELNKLSKWNLVRSVPKVLMFAKRDEEENENPFKGITYKGRPEKVPPLAIR